MENPTGTIVFSTIGRTNYGFDIFSVKLSSISSLSQDHRLTDGISISYNASFVDEEQTIVYISERNGSPQIHLNRPGIYKPELLPCIPASLFHDRPVLRNDRLYFVSAHERPVKALLSWSAVYSTGVEDGNVVRLSPEGVVDYSPAVSQSGKFVAVASYGSRPWGGEFHELETDIVVFSESDPSKRTVVCEHGGWPSWCGDSVIYFHRQAEDGWWSIFRINIPADFEFSGETNAPVRVTPSGVHAFTPAAMHDGKGIAVATRRKGSKFRHIEIFDLESTKFISVTESINSNFHHYSPFVSPGSGFLGYHRFRGESSSFPAESTIPHLERVSSPIKDLRMLRINGLFPSFSPNGDFIALNPSLDPGGLNIVKSDGTKRWTVFKGRTTFYNSWSPTEKNVIFSAIGPIFASVGATVQIARISFDSSPLHDGNDITSDLKILTREDTGNNAFPFCSPDGKSIVFRSGRSGHKNLYIMDAVNGEFNGNIRQLTAGDCIDTMPSWSPDGKLIAFSSNRHNPDNAEVFSIYIVKPDGSDLRRVYIAGKEGSREVDRERINHVCFSKDCKWLLFTANLGGVTAEPVSWPNQFQPYGDLHVARLDGSGLTRLTWNGYENGTPTWYHGEDHELGRLCLEIEVGDKLTGEFDEPLWISGDI